MINLVNNLAEDGKFSKVNTFNEVVAWFLRKAFRKAGVESQFVKDWSVGKVMPPKADHTIVFSNVAIKQVRRDGVYLKNLRESTSGKVTLYLDADFPGWQKWFDYVFTVVEPHQKNSKQFIYAGWGADPGYCYREQGEKAIFLDSLMWGWYNGNYDRYYKIRIDVSFCAFAAVWLSG